MDTATGALDPGSNGGQPSIGCITQGMFFFRVRKDTLNGLGTQGVGCFAKRRMADILRPFQIILPDVALNCFSALPALRAAFTYRAAFANVAFALVLPISITVGGRITQDLVLWAEDTIVIFIVNIFIPRQVALPGHRALIGQGRDSFAVEDLFAYHGV